MDRHRKADLRAREDRRWDAALKRGDPSTIGILSYLTPLASTLLLILTSDRRPTVWIAAAAVLIVGAAVVGMRAR